jgi:Domain of unknown function (DUF4294)
MKYAFFGILLFFGLRAVAQDQEPESDTNSIAPKGAWARREITNGDTVYLMSLPPVRISAKRKFVDLKEQRQFSLYTRAAKNVYPYALDAIELYNQIQEDTKDMKKRARKRHIKQENKEIKSDLEDKLKNLSKTEGKVLIKMIEMNLNKPFYDVIKELRGGSKAVYWQTLGKLYGYDLKEGYAPGKDYLLDAVLQDYTFGEAIWVY